MAELWWPLMDGPSVETPYCCVCGARWPLNRHHVVKRSAATRTAKARGWRRWASSAFGTATETSASS